MIYLASQSPRRAQLLEQLGVRFELLLPDDSEDAEALEVVRAGEAPLAYVKRVTALKLGAALARARRRGLADRPVLCSDTTVALGRRIFGKPENEAHACEMLAQLAGRTHRVLTAVAVGTQARQALCVQVSQVRFAPLSEAEIQAYVASGEPQGKAGAYGIQGGAAKFVAHISGSYTGIMGLPLHETAGLLRSFGVEV